MVEYLDLFHIMKEFINCGEEVGPSEAPVEVAGVRIDRLKEGLKKGDKGPEVKNLQKVLKSLGFDIGRSGVDGIFGKNTDKALKQFKIKFNEMWEVATKERVSTFEGLDLEHAVLTKRVKKALKLWVVHKESKRARDVIEISKEALIGRNGRDLVALIPWETGVRQGIVGKFGKEKHPKFAHIIAGYSKGFTGHDIQNQRLWEVLNDLPEEKIKVLLKGAGKHLNQPSGVSKKPEIVKTRAEAFQEKVELTLDVAAGKTGWNKVNQLILFTGPNGDRYDYYAKLEKRLKKLAKEHLESSPNVTAPAFDRICTKERRALTKEFYQNISAEEFNYRWREYGKSNIRMAIGWNRGRVKAGRAFDEFRTNKTEFLEKYASIIDQAAAENNIPKELILKLMRHESKWDPIAVSTGYCWGVGQLSSRFYSGVGGYDDKNEAQRLQKERFWKKKYPPINPLNPVEAIPRIAKIAAEYANYFESQGEKRDFAVEDITAGLVLASYSSVGYDTVIKAYRAYKKDKKLDKLKAKMVDSKTGEEFKIEDWGAILYIKDLKNKNPNLWKVAIDYIRKVRESDISPE